MRSSEAGSSPRRLAACGATAHDRPSEAGHPENPGLRLVSHEALGLAVPVPWPCSCWSRFAIWGPGFERPPSAAKAPSPGSPVTAAGPALPASCSSICDLVPADPGDRGHGGARFRLRPHRWRADRGAWQRSVRCARLLMCRRFGRPAAVRVLGSQDLAEARAAVRRRRRLAGRALADGCRSFPEVIACMAGLARMPPLAFLGRARLRLGAARFRIRRDRSCRR